MGSQDSTPKIAVIIPCRGHASELRRCLEGLMQSKRVPPHEVIVVSAEENAEVVATVKMFASVQLVGNGSLLLPGEARNLGAANTKADILAFIDADCIPDMDWIATAAQSLIPPRRLIGGPVLDAFPMHPIAICDNLLQFADFAPGRPSGQADYFPSCNMALRRKDFVSVGGFDHRNQPFGEDTAFCEKIRDQWADSLWFEPSMRVRHSGRLTMRDYLKHHHGFGYVRGVLGLHLKPWHFTWGKRSVMLLPIALKRLIYITKRISCWRKRWVPVFVLVMPLVLIGLISWAIGFQKGLRFRGK